MPHESAIRRVWTIDLPTQSGVWNYDVKKNEPEPYLQFVLFDYSREKKSSIFHLLPFVLLISDREKIQSENQFNWCAHAKLGNFIFQNFRGNKSTNTF